MFEASGVSKSYGGVVALRDVGLNLLGGSVHALLGENGAGKSTLVKIIAGAVRPDAGVLRLDGEQTSFASTAAAASAGVALVSQELSLFPDLDLLANLYPMCEPTLGPFVRRSVMEREATPVLRDLGLDASLRQTVGSLSIAERQLVEICRALLTKPRVLVLDEPTSALERTSVEALLRVLRVLRDRNVAVLYVSHILEEVMEVCDDITVLRDGEVVVGGVPRSELTISSIVDAMLGERHTAGVPTIGAAPATRLTTQVVMLDSGAASEPETKHGADDGASTSTSDEASAREDAVTLARVTVRGRLDDVDLVAPAGRVVGLAGLAGAGHKTVLELICGIRSPSEGTVLLPGRRPVPGGLPAAIRAGVAVVSGDRRRLGLMLDKPVWENIAAVRAVAMGADGVFLSRGNLRDRARDHCERLMIRASSVDQKAGLLSGGNQQKLVFAKWLDAQPTVLLLDDPTRGVDVGAKAEMHVMVRAVATMKTVVVMCSTDIGELAELCDNVVVFHQGRPCAEFSGDALSERAILAAMNGQPVHDG